MLNLLLAICNIKKIFQINTFKVVCVSLVFMLIKFNVSYVTLEEERLMYDKVQ